MHHFWLPSGKRNRHNCVEAISDLLRRIGRKSVSVNDRNPLSSIGVVPNNTEKEVLNMVKSSGGPHHVALGVQNMEKMVAFYHEVLEFTNVIAEFPPSEQAIMHEVTRTARAEFSVAILEHKAGGVWLEFIHMIDPAPRPIRSDFRFGDIGVAKITLGSGDVPGAYEALRSRVDFCSSPKTAHIDGFGDYTFFYCKDPEGNLVEIAADRKRDGRELFTGLQAIGISVLDLDRSMAFYGKQVGFDQVIIPTHGSFSGLMDEIMGAPDTQVRTCRLSSNADGNGMIDLCECLIPRGRSIPFATRWGDFGYLQVAFDCTDVPGIAAAMQSGGMELLCTPKIMPAGSIDTPGEFVYVRDPDGIPIEFLFIP